MLSWKGRSFGSAFNGTRQIVLMVDVDQTPPLGQLGSAFQLTPAEIRLWEALSEGRSLAFLRVASLGELVVAIERMGRDHEITNARIVGKFER